MMKTISYNEYEVMRSTLKEYYEYLLQHPDSMITRYFGLHKILMKDKKRSSKTYYFVMMKNIFRTSQDLKYKFDLKGSLFKRETISKLPDIS